MSARIVILSSSIVWYQISMYLEIKIGFFVTIGKESLLCNSHTFSYAYSIAFVSLRIYLFK